MMTNDDTIPTNLSKWDKLNPADIQQVLSIPNPFPTQKQKELNNYGILY